MGPAAGSAAKVLAQTHTHTHTQTLTLTLTLTLTPTLPLTLALALALALTLTLLSPGALPRRWRRHRGHLAQGGRGAVDQVTATGQRALLTHCRGHTVPNTVLLYSSCAYICMYEK